MNAASCRFASMICAALGFLSIIGSLGVWFLTAPTTGNEATIERLALFVGLWPPTFFALAAYLYIMGTRKNAMRE